MILKGLIIWLILVLIVNFIDSWILKDYGKIFMSILFCFIWICPCGSISIGEAGNDNFIEVWCLGKFSSVKKWLDILCFSDSRLV